jgi:hypothetical protein
MFLSPGLRLLNWRCGAVREMQAGSRRGQTLPPGLRAELRRRHAEEGAKGAAEAFQAFVAGIEADPGHRQGGQF